MQAAPLAPDEEKRLALLRALDLLDTPPEPVFDLITRMVANATGAPIAMVSLIDRHRQWFKSKVGLEVSETPREYAFCAHCILGSEILLVPDALQDDRFFDNPLVTGSPGVRFYAGVPLRSAEGLALGSLCVLDTVPRDLSPRQLELLHDAAQLVNHEIARREATLLVRQNTEFSMEAGRDSEARFRAVFEGAAVGIALLAPDGRLIEANQALGRIVGAPAAELTGMPLQDMIDPADRPAELALRGQLASGLRSQYSLETRYGAKSGAFVWVNLTVAARHGPDGQVRYFSAIVENIDARRQAQAALQALQQTLEQQVDQRTRELRHAHEQLQTITDHLPVLIGYFDLELRYRFANAAYKTVVGKAPGEMIGLTLAETFGPGKAAEIVEYVEQVKRQRTRVSFETPLTFPDGSVHYGAVTLIPDITEEQLVGFHSIVYDITERRQREQATRLEARLDALTELPNRRAVQERLPRAMALADQRASTLEILFIDLDGFKQVNDTLGHAYGDLLLKEIAQRLRSGLPQAELVARLAGDEFIVVLHSEPARPQGEIIAKRILSSIAQPVRLGEHEVHVTGSVGIAIYRAGSGTSPTNMLRAADMAMYEAKRAGKSQYRFGPETGLAAT